MRRLEKPVSLTFAKDVRPSPSIVLAVFLLSLGAEWSALLSQAGALDGNAALPDNHSRKVTEKATNWADDVMAQAEQVLSIGRNIWIINQFELCFVREKDMASFHTLKEAPSGRFATATDFFSFMVTSGLTIVEFTFFSAPGIPAERSRDASRFKAENNAWCVVGDTSSLQSTNSPIYFTRNVHIDRLGTDVGIADIHGTPFGTNCAVVVMKNGGGRILRGVEEITAYFSALTETNRVLRP